MMPAAATEAAVVARKSRRDSPRCFACAFIRVHLIVLCQWFEFSPQTAGLMKTDPRDCSRIGSGGQTQTWLLTRGVACAPRQFPDGPRKALSQPFVVASLADGHHPMVPRDEPGQAVIRSSLITLFTPIEEEDDVYELHLTLEAGKTYYLMQRWRSTKPLARLTRNMPGRSPPTAHAWCPPVITLLLL